MAEPEHVGRLAPSPTGLLHLGHARSFLVAWWYARRAGGRILLRIEDLDGPRVRPEFVAAAERDLAWLGLDWDGPRLLQSESEGQIREAAQRLVAQGLAYPCICTRSEARASARRPGIYPGTCRERFDDVSQAKRASGRDAALRFRSPSETVTVHDRLRGITRFEPERTQGDFVVVRREGLPAYQLAVVVDDAAQGVTDVVRGDDLLESTPGQQLLQAALGLPTPRYAHLPLVVDENGRRYAKHYDSLSLAALRQAGVDPRRIVQWAARSSGIDGAGAARAASFCGSFELDRLPREPIRVSRETLKALHAPV